MGYKMNGAPKMANTKSHGTNKNYQKSGAPRFFENLMKGKGALGAINPLGAIASRLGAFGKKDNSSATAPPPADPNTVDPNAMVATGANAMAADPNQVEQPMMPGAAMGKHLMKGAPMYGKKKGAPKLKGNQREIDKNKDGQISKADFDMMNKKGAPKYKKKGAPNYKKGYYGVK
tara:strand:+ start:954 stop:1478 length:525 start_codon:yes stop_codon:yes gene_type:complete